MPKFLTQQDVDNIIRYRQEGLSYDQVSEKTGLHRSTVARKCREHENGVLSARQTSKQKIKDLVQKLVNDRFHMSRKAVAVKNKLSESYVAKLLCNHPERNKFYKNKTTYTQEQWDQALLLKKRGRNYKEISQITGISAVSVRKRLNKELGLAVKYIPRKDVKSIYIQVASDRKTMTTKQVAEKYGKSIWWVNHAIKESGVKVDNLFKSKKLIKKQKQIEPKGATAPKPDLKQDTPIIIKDKGPTRSLAIDKKTSILGAIVR